MNHFTPYTHTIDSMQKKRLSTFLEKENKTTSDRKLTNKTIDECALSMEKKKQKLIRNINHRGKNAEEDVVKAAADKDDDDDDDYGDGTIISRNA